MGLLIHPATGARCTLNARHLVGRSPRCDLRINHSQISGEHATLTWNGEHWQIRDLGSRNGTKVNDVALEVGEARALAAGDRLFFGHPEAEWEVASVDPPIAAALRCVDGRVRMAEHQLLTLPNHEEPEALVYLDSAGNWVLEREWERGPVADLDEIEVGGQLWRLHLPEPLPETQDAVEVGASLHACTLVFRVSADEEYVNLTLRTDGGAVIDLEDRVHHYCLLTLARLRLADAEQATLEPAQHGWIYHDELAKTLAVDLPQVNMLIFRARRQFHEAGILDATAVIERRKGPRTLRIGTDRVEIQRV